MSLDNFTKSDQLRSLEKNEITLKFEVNKKIVSLKLTQFFFHCNITLNDDVHGWWNKTLEGWSNFHIIVKAIQA